MAEPAGTSSIVLRGLQVHASHGVYEYERQTKQLFLVDIVANLSTLRAAATDDLKETLNYGQLAEETMAIMTGSPVMLIETLAERIADQVLTHPIVESVEVTVHKPNAPIQHPFEDVAVKILRVRGGSKDNVTTSIPRVAITAGTPEGFRAARTTGVISRMVGGGSVSRRANLSQAERVVLSLGGNLGDIPLNLSRAVALLMEIPGFQIDAVSPLVSTRAVLAPGQGSMPNYGNIVVLGRTALEPRELLAHTQNIEDNFGRDRSQVWAARQVDIDLVAVGEQQINTPDLVLPHPRAAVRAFVLYPWYLVEPNAQLQGMPIAQLLEVAPDRDGILEVQENWLREPGGQMAEASGTPGVGASAAVAGAGAVGGTVAGAVGSGAMGAAGMAAGMAGGAAFAGQDMVGHYAANPAAFSQGGTGRVSAGQGVAAQGAALNSSGSPTGGTRNVADAVAAIASAANAVISAAGRATGANTANTVSAAGVAGSAVTAAGDAANAVSGRVQIRGVDVELTENDSDFVFRNLLRKEADREAAQRAYASTERLAQQSQEQARAQAQAQQAQQAQVRAQLGQTQQFAAQQLGQQTIAQQGAAQLAAQPQLQQTGTHQTFPQSAQVPAANQAAQQTRAQAQRAAMQSGSGPFAVQQIAQQAQQPQGAAQQQALQMQQPGQPQAAGQPGSRVAQNISAQQATQRVAPQPVQQAAAQQTQVQVQLGQAQQVAAQPALGQQPGQPVQQQTALAANQAAAARQAGQQIGQMVGQAFAQQGAPQGVQQPAQAQGHAQAQQFAAQQGVAQSVSPQGTQGQAAPQIQPSSASTPEPRPFATRAAIRQQQQLQQQTAQNASQQAVAQAAQQATGQTMPSAVPPQGVMQANQPAGQTRLVELNSGLTAQGQLAQPAQNGQVGHPVQNAHAAQAGAAASTQGFASAPYVPGVSRTSNAATAGAANAGAVQLPGQAQQTPPNPQAAPSQLQQPPVNLQQQGQAPAESSMRQLGQPQLQAQPQLQGRAQSQGRGQPQQQAGQQSQPQAQPKSHIPTGIPAASITPNREAASAKAPVIDNGDLFPSREALAGDSVPDDRARQWTGNLQQRAKEALSQSRVLPEWRVTQESAGARVFDATNGGGVSEELFLPELFASNSKGDQGNTAIAVATGNTPPSPALGVSVNKNGQVVRSSIHPSSRAATPNGAASNAGGSGYPPPDIPGVSGIPAGQGQVQSQRQGQARDQAQGHLGQPQVGYLQGQAQPGSASVASIGQGQVQSQGQGQAQVASPAVIPAQLNLIDDGEPVDRPRLSRGVTVRPTPAGQVPVNPNGQF